MQAQHILFQEEKYCNELSPKHLKYSFQYHSDINHGPYDMRWSYHMNHFGHAILDHLQIIRLDYII